MNLTVHIEQLILDGLPVTSHDAPLVCAAVEVELTRLFAEQGISPSRHVGATLPHVRTGSISVVPDMRPAQLGNAIAGALHSTIRNAPVPASTKKSVPPTLGAIG